VTEKPKALSPCGAALVRLLLLACALAPAASPARAADEVLMKDRTKRYTGVILSEGYETIALDTNSDGKADVTVRTQEVARITHGDAPTSYNSAVRLFRRGRYDQALTAFQKALEAPGVRAAWLRPEVNYYLGECYLRQAWKHADNLKKAAEHFTAVLTKTPTHRRVPDCRLGLAECALEQGNRAEASKHLEDLASGKYGTRYALLAVLRLARLKADPKNPAETVALCEKARRLAADEALKDLRLDADFACARALAAAGKGAEAEAILKRLAEEHGEPETDVRARLFNTLGDVFLAQNRVKEALLAYLRVRILYFQSKDELARALYGAGICFRTLRDAARAEAVIGELLQEHGDTRWAARARKEFPNVK